MKQLIGKKKKKNSKCINGFQDYELPGSEEQWSLKDGKQMRWVQFTAWRKLPHLVTKRETLGSAWQPLWVYFQWLGEIPIFPSIWRKSWRRVKSPPRKAEMRARERIGFARDSGWVQLFLRTSDRPDLSFSSFFILCVLITSSFVKLL